MAIRIIELSKLNSETRNPELETKNGLESGVRGLETQNSELKTLMLRAGKDISDVSETSKQIIDDVKARGDEALFDYEKRFTAVELSAETIRVTKEEIAEAYSKINKRLLKAIKHAAKNIEKFHRKCLPGEFEMKIEKGVKAGRLIRPVGRAGLYIPGGKAVYPSVMLMLSIPAKVAGVNEIVACTPLQKGANSLDVATLVAADIGGVSEIYKVGGAQAIAALAYGTKTIKRTDVIAGPGNPYVSAAQKLVRNDVRIDFIPGPSEGMVLADESANPMFVTLDLLSEAEHGPDSAGIVVTPSLELAQKTREIAEQLIDALPEPGKGYVRANMAAYSAIIVASSMDEAINFVNEYATEYLVLNVREPKEVLAKIKNAGTICLGEWTPITAGNFIVGPNAVLPTNSLAKYYSGVNVDTFLRKPTYEWCDEDGLKRLSRDIGRLADFEGFPMHTKSVKSRFATDATS